MPVIEKGDVTLHYEEAGDGFPMLVLPGGGLNATTAYMTSPTTFNPLVEFADTHRCIALNIRNSFESKSRGPLEPSRPWDAFTDDQLTLMDHLGIEKFAVTGFCIGGPLIWNLIRRAPNRVVAAILAHPSGFRPEAPDLFYQNNINDWAKKAVEQRDDITQDMVEEFLNNMYPEDAEFVFTVDRDFVQNCDKPLMIMPDDIATHPFAAAMETARLAPNAEVSLFPWRQGYGQMELALRHARTFLAAHTPAG